MPGRYCQGLRCGCWLQVGQVIPSLVPLPQVRVHQGQCHLGPGHERGGGRVQGGGRKQGCGCPPLLPFRLNVANIELATWVRANSDPRASYHIGADYLLGRPGARTPLTLPDALGLVGSVLFFLHPRSTVTKSLHISRPGGGALAPTYEASPTYDEMWNASVQTFATSQSEVSAQDMWALYGAHRGGAVDLTAYIGLQLSLGVSYETAVREYCRHEAALHEARRGRNEDASAVTPGEDALCPLTGQAI
jgi:hypothetical protein